MEHHIRIRCRKNFLNFNVLTNITGMMGYHRVQSTDTIIIPGCFWSQSYTGDCRSKVVKPECKPGAFKPGIPGDEDLPAIVNFGKIHGTVLTRFSRTLRWYPITGSGIPYHGSYPCTPISRDVCIPSILPVQQVPQEGPPPDHMTHQQSGG